MNIALTPTFRRAASQRALAIATTVLMAAAPAAAQVTSGPAEGLRADQLLQLVRATVDAAVHQAQLAQSAQIPGLRMESEVGSFDPQLRLAPCQVAEPYLPAGTRPWGSIRIGLRCVQGPVRWNVFVPAQIRVFAPVVVAGAGLPSGHPVQVQDLTIAEAEISAEAGVTLQDPLAAVGRTTTVALKAGQAVRAQHLRARQWFAAGESVTMVAKGPGFQISSEGVALSPGIEGQVVRIRTEGGRVVSGQAVGARRVDVAL